MPFYRNCFELKFRELAEFYNANNRWPSLHSEDKQERCLGLWCHSQRLKYNKGSIDLYAVRQLERIQFPWSLLVLEWEQKFEGLKAFISQHKKLPPGRHPLYAFSFRHYKEFEKLAEEKKKRLREIGFVRLWDKQLRKRKYQWDDNLYEIKSFLEQQGKLPSITTDQRLHIWIKAQRQKFRKGSLSKERIEKLKEAGIPLQVKRFTKNISNWEEQYNKLKHFVFTNQRLPYCKENPDLYGWCLQQRRRYTLKKLSMERMEKMKALNVNLEIRKRVIAKRMTQLERCA